VISRLRLRVGVKEMQQVEDGQSVISPFERAFATIAGDMSTPTSQST
jgi:hypothetical protein